MKRRVVMGIKRRRKAWCLVVGLRIEERHALEE
jgi:hypothetical protein